MKNYLAILTLLFIVLSSCQKDKEINKSEEPILFVGGITSDSANSLIKTAGCFYVSSGPYGSHCSIGVTLDKNDFQNQYYNTGETATFMGYLRIDDSYFKQFNIQDFGKIMVILNINGEDHVLLNNYGPSLNFFFPLKYSFVVEKTGKQPLYLSIKRNTETRPGVNTNISADVQLNAVCK